MTFSIFTQETNKGKDDRYPLSIKVYHNGVPKYIPTIYRAPRSAFGKKDLTLRDPYLLKILTEKIEDYEKEIKKMGTVVETWTAQEVKEYLTKEKGEKISIVDFAQKYTDKLRRRYGEDKKKGAIGNINTALNSIVEFSNKLDLLFTDITAKFLQEYEDWLFDVKKIKGRGASLYTSNIRMLFNRAREEYNDEEKNIMLIPYPFKKYKVPAMPTTRKRALSKEKILAIYNYKPEYIRDELARDMFILSFLLVGMNAADLYECPKIENGRITYNRKKTRERRKDRAEISIKVEPEAMSIIKKYADKTYLLNLKHHYSTAGNLNQALNGKVRKGKKGEVYTGLKKIGAVIGVDDLEFYAARHSWASIAQNKVGIDKYSVHAALNHVIEEMKVTDIYTERDWSPIDRANRKVIDYVFGKNKKPPIS